MRSASEFKFPVFCIYSSLEAKFFSAIRVFDGYVILSGPVDFQTGLLQGRKHVRAAGHGSLPDALPQIFMDGLLGFAALVRARSLAPSEQTGFV